MSQALAAQHPSDSDRLQLEVTPLFGYRTNMSFKTDPDADGITSKFVFDASPAYGFAIGFRSHDEDVVEFRWSRQDTRTGWILNQFHLDCSHEYVVDEWPAWARPYIMASVGATHISNTTNFPVVTRFSFGLGAGIKIFPSPRVGFKVQAEWLPVWITQKAKAFCSGGCVVRFSGQLGSQGEVTAGPVFRF
jgi:opacity protein-like surface antigen